MHETTGGFPDVLDRRGDLSRNSDSQRVLRGCSGRASDAGRLQSVLFLRNAAGFFQKNRLPAGQPLLFTHALLFRFSSRKYKRTFFCFHSRFSHERTSHWISTSCWNVYENGLHCFRNKRLFRRLHTLPWLHLLDINLSRSIRRPTTQPILSEIYGFCKR